MYWTAAIGYNPKKVNHASVSLKMLRPEHTITYFASSLTSIQRSVWIGANSHRKKQSKRKGEGMWVIINHI